jgi:cysteine sulfinate desulfinase/cysteine desulfurase-like protein
VISSALRFSFGVSTTSEDVAEGCRRIINVCNGLRR